ncbi:MAG TPA: hypothetical protein VMV12_01845 [Candidatus Micrarchaeaceae archaeon]|nr:hypothetical protein [Candidatus Micrarchaeaceae archaeon]
MTMTADAASTAARELARARWDRVTNPEDRTAATAKAVAAHVAAGRRRRAAIDLVIDRLTED